MNLNITQVEYGGSTKIIGIYTSKDIAYMHMCKIIIKDMQRGAKYENEIEPAKKIYFDDSKILCKNQNGDDIKKLRMSWYSRFQRIYNTYTKAGGGASYTLHELNNMELNKIHNH